MKQSRILVLSLAAVLLLALLAACGGDSDEPTTTNTTGQSQAAATSSDEPDEQSTSSTGSESSSEPTPTEEAASADAEATEEEVNDDDQTPTDSTGGNRLVGSASVDDDTDDVANILMQDPDEPMPGIDLTNVTIEGDGSEMVVTIQTAGDIEAELSDDIDVSFDVHLWQDDRPAYAMSFHHNGSDDWEATVTDFSIGLGEEETIDTEISIAGNTLSAAFPVSMLPDLEDSFEWYSSVILSEGGMMIGPNSWFDGAPENVISLLANPEEFVEFPQ
ncbi:MAG TPA: hypothetical protein VEX37_15760 [Thermomicrobiales bacterium]|nr:hypothetical protein [Thermomicrobiales bacterium]